MLGISNGTSEVFIESVEKWEAWRPSFLLHLHFLVIKKNLVHTANAVLAKASAWHWIRGRESFTNAAAAELRVSPTR